MNREELKYKQEQIEAELGRITKSIVKICKDISRRSKVSGIWYNKNIELENQIIGIIKDNYDHLPWWKKLFTSYNSYLNSFLKLSIREFKSIAIKNEHDLQAYIDRSLAMPEEVYLNMELSHSIPLKEAHEKFDLNYSELKRIKIKQIELDLKEAENFDERREILAAFKRDNELEFIESNDLVKSVFFNDKSTLSKREISKVEEIQRKFDEKRKFQFENSYESDWLKIQTQYSQNVEFLKTLNNESEHDDDFIQFVLNTSITTEQDLQNYVTRIIDENIRHKIAHHKGHKIFWHENQPLREDEFQDSFINMFSPFLELKYISISREPQISEGKIDLFLSFNPHKKKLMKMCLEIKKAHNKVELGVTKQLPQYLEGMQTDRGIYIVLWFKGELISEPKSYIDINNLKEALDELKPNEYKINNIVIDVNKLVSPSKHK